MSWCPHIVQPTPTSILSSNTAAVQHHDQHPHHHLHDQHDGDQHHDQLEEDHHHDQHGDHHFLDKHPHHHLLDQHCQITVLILISAPNHPGKHLDPPPNGHWVMPKKKRRLL